MGRTTLSVVLIGLALLSAGCGAGAGSTKHGTTATSSPGASSTPPPPATTVTAPPPTTTPHPPATTPPPTPPPPSGYRLPDRLRGVEWSRLPTTRKVVALTFDGGSNAAGAQPILSTLRAEGVTHATFFLTGRWAGSYPGLAREIAAAGFSIGNHTTTHPHLPALTDAQIVQEVRGAGSAIRAATSVDPRPLFRFPYGDSSPRALRLVNDLGFVSIRWTVDTLGWEGASAGITTGSIVARVMAGLQPGEIVLMHMGSAPDGSTLDANALAQVIHSVRAHGYIFGSVSDFTGRASS